MSTPAGIGFCNNDGSVCFIIISDNGWIKDGIGDILALDYHDENYVKKMVLDCSLPQGYDLLFDQKTGYANDELAFMQYCFFRPHCYIFYTYTWKNGQWYFRRLDGSEDIPLKEAINQGIED